MGAEKISEDYASNRDSFASAGLAEVPQIVLLANQIVNGVTVRFGPKSAKLTGRIIDASTKKSVEDWKYSSSLTLSSGQRRELVISLQPK
jgi:hypothetical protein